VVILISALTFLLSGTNPLLRQSTLAPYVQQSAQFLVKTAPGQVQALFKKKQEELKRYWLEREEEQGQKGNQVPSAPPHTREGSENSNGR
jgi:hypothetical protein